MKYRMFAKSVPGPKYTAKGWECQDNSGKKEFDCAQIIAVADGHGGSDHFRSEWGSAMAIETAFQQTELYCKSACEYLDEPICFSETSIANFKYSIWQEWRKVVKTDWDIRLLRHGILGDGEVRFGAVSDKYKARFTSEAPDVREHYLYKAYGTTLLVAIAIESQMLLLQIGDGSCVLLQRNGEFRMPVPHDEDNFLNIVVSLCGEKANLKIRHAVIDCNSASPTAPAAVFLSSDGLDDCYPLYENEQYLYKLYTTILESILDVGFEETEAEIENDLLPGLTAQSSKDDISLAFFVNEEMDVLREAFENIKPCYKVYANASEADTEAGEKTHAKDDIRSESLEKISKKTARDAEAAVRQDEDW